MLFTTKQIKENENIKIDLNAIQKNAFEGEKKFNNIDKLEVVKKTNKIEMFILINWHIEFYILIGI